MDREGRDVLPLKRSLQRRVDRVVREGLRQAAAPRHHQLAAPGQRARLPGNRAYFPMQNRPNITPSRSSAVNSPVIVPSAT